jgi:hypothetical protein
VSPSPQTEHEAALIRAFVIPGKRARLVELLSKPKRRKDVLRSLAHFGDLDPRFQLPIPPSEQSAAAIEKHLRARGAPADCYVISEDAALDARTLLLSDALRSIVAHGMGSLPVLRAWTARVLRRREPRRPMAP